MLSVCMGIVRPHNHVSAINAAAAVMVKPLDIMTNYTGCYNKVYVHVRGRAETCGRDASLSTTIT